MAMTFTLVSHLREELLALVKRRVEKQIEEEKEKERRALEVGQSKIVLFDIIHRRQLCLFLGRRSSNKRYTSESSNLHGMERKVRQGDGS